MSIDRRTEEAGRLAEEWSLDPRWEGVERPYGADEVVRLRGSVRIEHSLARLGAERLWQLLQDRTTSRPSARRRACRPCRW